MRWMILLLLLTLLAPPVSAQDPAPQEALYDFELQVPDPDPVFVPFAQMGTAEMLFIDRSRDSTSGAISEAPPAYGLLHSVSFDERIVAGDPEGWVIQPMTPFSSKGGTERVATLTVLAGNTIRDHTIQIEVTAEITTRDGKFYRNASFQFFTDGLNGFTARLGKTIDRLEPSEIGQASIFLSNPGLFPETYHTEIISNPCGIPVGPPASLTLLPRETNRELTFSVQGPEDKLWYFTEACTVDLSVYPASTPEQAKRIPISVVVDGGYLDPEVAFWVLALLVAAIIAFLFLRRRKEAVEEEILGKPQKPWTIPVERVYLEHLEANDERAAYVVRHFLMEEEYQSALLWYKSYKKATRGERSKERVVVSQERKFERFQKQWEKKIAAPMKTADRFEAKLQKKLDRKAKKAVRKDRKKWKTIVAKMDGAHEKKKQREMAKWEKAANRAQKKGQEAPPRPEIRAPDYPPEPEWQRIELADHKWQKKADKFRRKMIKRQGNLEVKYEKKEARLLAKLQRKVRRIARKIDDPDFEKEHPILGSAET